ncbi:MAG TPA: hypothetical protein DER23_07400 [Clostridiales bacterium]|nr:hypothetical protein [Clostridiales bacterium]
MKSHPVATLILFFSISLLFCGCSSEAEEPTADTLKLNVATYNIKHGEVVKCNFSLLAQDITDAGPDIVGLQEVDRNTKRNGGANTLAILSEETGLPYYAFAKTLDLSVGEYGIGILSRYPILSFNTVNITSENSVLKDENRAVGHAVIDMNGTQIHFFVSHTAYKNASLRKQQFRDIKALLPEGEPFIIAGDFNTPDFTEFNVFDDVTLVNNKRTTYGTFTENDSPIDNILLSRDWKIVSSAMAVTGHSDHNLLLATIQLKQSYLLMHVVTEH